MGKGLFFQKVSEHICTSTTELCTSHQSQKKPVMKKSRGSSSPRRKALRVQSNLIAVKILTFVFCQIQRSLLSCFKHLQTSVEVVCNSEGCIYFKPVFCCNDFSFVLSFICSRMNTLN